MLTEYQNYYLKGSWLFGYIFLKLPFIRNMNALTITNSKLIFMLKNFHMQKLSPHLSILGIIHIR